MESWFHDLRVEGGWVAYLALSPPMNYPVCMRGVMSTATNPHA